MSANLSVLEQSGLGLQDLNLSDLLKEKPKEESGYGEIDINLIEEDPEQPRTEKNPGFSTQSIEELADSIQTSGLLQPITIRNHPDKHGMYMIKDGARRYRASKKNSAQKIAAIIVKDDGKSAAEYHLDQLAMNLQKEDNTPLEIAETIKKGLAQGLEKQKIAKRIGRSPGWLTVYVALLELPDELSAVQKSGKITDANILYELSKLYKTNRDDVMSWVNTPGQEFTRGQLKLFQEYLDTKKRQNDDEVIDRLSIITDEQSENTDSNQLDRSDEPETNKEPTSPPVIQGETGKSDNAIKNQATTSPIGDDGNDDHSQVIDDKSQTSSDQTPSVDPKLSADKFKKAIVLVKHDDRPARLLLDKRPSASGYAWLKYEDDGHIFESMLSDVSLTEVIEG